MSLTGKVGDFAQHWPMTYLDMARTSARVREGRFIREYRRRHLFLLITHKVGGNVILDNIIRLQYRKSPRSPRLRVTALGMLSALILANKVLYIGIGHDYYE